MLSAPPRGALIITAGGLIEHTPGQAVYPTEIIRATGQPADFRRGDSRGGR